MSRTRRRSAAAFLSFALSACIYEEYPPDDTPPSDRGVILESEPNDAAPRAGELRFGAPVRGHVERGDRDWWRLELDAGELVTLQVFGTRFDQEGWSANPPTLRVVAPGGVATRLLQDSRGEPSFGWGVVDPDVPAYRAETSGAHYFVVAADDAALAGGAYLLLAQELGVALAEEVERAGTRGTNDAPAAAEPLAAGVLAGFHVDDEDDWFRVTVPERSLLTFAVLSHRNGLWGGDDDTFDSALALFDAHGVELARNDDGAFDDAFLAWLCVSCGEYLLRVGESGATGDAPYFLIHTVRALADALAEEEPNDTPSSAPFVPFERLVEGELGPGDTDVFAVPCLAGDRLEVWVHDRGRHERARGALSVALLDAHGEPVTMDEGADLGVRTALISADGIAFLRLATDEPGGTPYAFEVRLETARFEVEPNDAPAEATAFDSARRAAGRIERPGDVDLFAFEAEAGVPVLLECFADDEFGSQGFDELDGDGSDLDPLLEVLDPRGARIAGASALPRTAVGLVRGRATVTVAFLPRASGVHVLAVRDARGGSGPSHTYVVQRN